MKILIFTIIIILLLSYPLNKIKSIEYKSKKKFILNKENLYELLINADIKYPKIALAQAILETGNFKSRGCKERKNLFGFYNGKRYLRFDSYEQCVEYYKKWQDKRYKSGCYYEFLNSIPYAEDKEYVIKLKKIKIDE